jgi:hypothetical protein
MPFSSPQKLQAEKEGIADAEAGSLVRFDESNHDAVLLQYYFSTVAQEKTNWTFCTMYVHIAALLPAIDSRD